MFKIFHNKRVRNKKNYCLHKWSWTLICPNFIHWCLETGTSSICLLMDDFVFSLGGYWLLGDRRLGFHLGSGVGAQEIFIIVELAPFLSMCQGNPQIPWMPEAWSLPVYIRLLNRVGASFSPQPCCSPCSWWGWGRGLVAGVSRWQQGWWRFCPCIVMEMREEKVVVSHNRSHSFHLLRLHEAKGECP